MQFLVKIVLVENKENPRQFIKTGMSFKCCVRKFTQPITQTNLTHSNPT